MTPEQFIGALQVERDDGPLRALASLSVEQLLMQNIGELLSPERVAEIARASARGWLASDKARAELMQLVERSVNRWSGKSTSLGSTLPIDVRNALKQLAEQPFSPDRRVVLTIIDRGPTRELVRELMMSTVLEFARRASAPVAGVARGLGSLAKIATESVKSRSGGLGSLVGAVSGEVERQLEKRAAEFVDAALGGVLVQIAEAIADPKRAHEAAALRKSMLDGVLELTQGQLARETMNVDVEENVKVIEQALGRWLASDAARTQLIEAASFFFEPFEQRKAGEVLEALGQREVVTAELTELIFRRLQAMVKTSEFQSWLGTVLNGAA